MKTERPSYELTSEARRILQIIADAHTWGRILQEEREELDDWVIRKDAAQN